MRAVCLTIKRLPSLLIAGAIVGCLPFVLTRPVVAQTPPNIKLNVNVPPQAPGNVAKEPVLSAAEIMALRDVVYFERRATILLERARQYLKDDELSLAFEALQSLLGDPQELLAPAQDWNRAPSDSFVLANGRLRSVRRETLMVFESLTRDQLNFYEKKYSETASSALQAARASGRSAAYLEVARRCFPTLAGAQATDEAATRLLDRGEAALAAKLWLRIIHSTIHRNRLNPRLFEKAATSLFLSGDKDQARTVVAEAVALFGSVRFTAKSIEVVAKNHPHFATPVMDSPASDPFGNRQLQDGRQVDWKTTSVIRRRGHVRLYWLFLGRYRCWKLRHHIHKRAGICANNLLSIGNRLQQRRCSGGNRRQLNCTRKTDRLTDYRFRKCSCSQPRRRQVNKLLCTLTSNNNGARRGLPGQ